MQYKYSIICLFLVTILAAQCRKGELAEIERSMKFSVDVFITDTSVFQKVELNGSTLSEKANMINGTYANIFNSPGGIHRPAGKIGLLEVQVIKKDPPNLVFSDSISLTNVNDYLLLQINPQKKAILINKLTESSKLQPPKKDSLMVRFFYNDADRIINPRNGNKKVSAVNLQLYTVGENASGMPSPKKSKLLENIKVNELSRYFSFRIGDVSGFDLLDADPTLNDSQRRLQRFSFDEYDFFKDGRVEIFDPKVEGLFQTLRIQREGGNVGAYIAKYLFAFR